MGDSFLITYESCTNAVIAGIEIQKAFASYNNKLGENDKIEIRVSISAGDVRMESNDVFGEAVNIASRLEKLTGPNQVLFTDAVFYTMNRSEVPCREIGTKKLSGVPYEVRVYEAMGTKVGRTVVAPRRITHLENEKPQQVSLDELLREVLKKISAAAASKNIRIQILPVRLRAHPVSVPPHSLKAALENLLHFVFEGVNGEGNSVKIGCSASIFRSGDLGFTKALMDCFPSDTTVVPSDRTGTFRGDPVAKIEVVYPDGAPYAEANELVAV
ncbi:MAG: hypothetical protein GF350_02065 [Chitinivibrionales bacterium]|nr:hypothetical protein [Chitinivibrionales bacterium]